MVGADYNVEPETAGRCTKVIKGLSSLTFGDGWNSIPGTDDETDDALRVRIYDRWRSLGSGNPPSKYEYLAESVTGVSEAKVIRAPRGYGSMDVVISSADGIPSAAVVVSALEVSLGALTLALLPNQNRASRVAIYALAFMLLMFGVYAVKLEVRPPPKPTGCGCVFGGERPADWARVAGADGVSAT